MRFNLSLGGIFSWVAKRKRCFFEKQMCRSFATVVVTSYMTAHNGDKGPPTQKPFSMSLGAFSRKSPEIVKAFITSLANHIFYGIGLSVGITLI
jgi:hypothetical protein